MRHVSSRNNDGRQYMLAGRAAGVRRPAAAPRHGTAGYIMNVNDMLVLKCGHYALIYVCVCYCVDSLMDWHAPPSHTHTLTHAGTHTLDAAFRVPHDSLGSVWKLSTSAVLFFVSVSAPS